MRDFAWPSVKLFAPAAGAPGLGGLFGVLMAGVLASHPDLPLARVRITVTGGPASAHTTTGYSGSLASEWR